jgi:hypothetical protein
VALEIRLAVTQPYHGPDGGLVHDVGELLPPGDPGDVRGSLVVVEAQDRPAPAKPAPAPPAKDAKDAKDGGA